MAIVNDQKQKYTLLSGTHMTGGVVYDAGDKNRNVIELTSKQAENMGDRVRLVGQSASEDENSNSGENVKDPNPNLSGGSAVPVKTEGIATDTDSTAKFTSLLSGNLSDVENEIGKIDSASDLDTLAKLEQSGKQRSGVMKMIRERKEELK